MEHYDNSELPDPATFAASHDVLRPEFDANGHVDEGSVHAWLDGAFGADDAALIDAHVSTCAVCQAQVAEARGLLAGSARILGALDGVPAQVVPQVDAVRTAERIATAVPTRANANAIANAIANASANASARRWWPAAAAALLIVGTTSVWQRSRGTAAVTVDSVAVEAPAAAAPSAAKPSAATPSAGAPPAAATAEGAAPAAAAATPVVPAPVAAALPPKAAQRLADAVSSEAERFVRAEPPAVVATEAARAEAPAFVAARTVVITGVVTASGRPVADAMVDARVPLSASAAQARTDAAGGYTLRVPNIRTGVAIDVVVRRIGYEVYTARRVVTADSLRVDVSLSVSAVSLSSVVVTQAPVKAEKSKAADASTRTNLVGAAAGAPAPMPTSMPITRGVAGGVARGVEMAMPSTVGAVRPEPSRVPGPPMNREQYTRIEDNPFQWVRNEPLSTFSVDVDRAAYGNVRRFLTQGQRPPKDAVRIEELINYFPYDLPEPKGSDPVAITTEVIAAPWQPQHQLVRIALQSRRIATANLPPNNLVFLIDVSGSMQSPDKLPLVKQSLRLLVDQLRPEDRVAIVVYAGAAGLVLPSTSGDEKATIMEAIDRLEAGGSTAGSAGILLAYQTAREHFLANGNNRVILATDGDFNVGATGGSLERLIELKRGEGIYLTMLGFGTGNYQDATMEALAKKGNGNYAYIDELSEARKMLVREMGATLLTVANDVKLQIEFNPAAVQGYRLIGYEDRLLANQDFNDDRKDAGDMGAGHQVTALYEIVPVGVTYSGPVPTVDTLRYTPPAARANGPRDELLYVKLRYKRPGDSASRLLQQAVSSRSTRGSSDTRFAAAVAEFGMLLRDSEYKAKSSAAQVVEMARAALGEDEGGYRAAFIELVERWRSLGRR
jgi:Ca-activated chloride channel family protein